MPMPRPRPFDGWPFEQRDLIFLSLFAFYNSTLEERERGKEEIKISA